MTYNQELRDKISRAGSQKLWLLFFAIDQNKIYVQKEFLKTAFMLPSFDTIYGYLYNCITTEDSIDMLTGDFCELKEEFYIINTRIKYWKAYDKKAYDKEELCLQNFDKQLYLRWNEHLDQFMYTEEEFNKTVYDKWVPYVDEIIELYKDVSKKITVLFYNAQCDFNFDKLIKNINEIINEFNLEVTNILDEAENLLTINLY